MKEIKHRKGTLKKLLDAIKIPNLLITVIDKGEESRVNGIKQIFSKVIEENFPKLRKDIPMQIQGSQRTPTRQDKKRQYTRVQNNQNIENH